MTGHIRALAPFGVFVAAFFVQLEPTVLALVRGGFVLPIHACFLTNTIISRECQAYVKQYYRSIEQIIIETRLSISLTIIQKGAATWPILEAP